MTGISRFICAVILTFILSGQARLHAETGTPLPGPRDKCPVCGMFVSSYKDWLAVIRMKNGSIAFFDGPKDMFTYYLNPGKFAPASKASDMTTLSVNDYYTLKQIDARKAFYVIGSDVFGPMGKELVPFSRKPDAQEFLADHKGKRIIVFKDISPALLKTLE